jgi:hypothetical protein
MNRRSILLGLTAALIPSTSLAQATLRIWGLWARDPTPNRNGVNQLKGTLYFRVNNDTSDRSLNVYGNGLEATDPARQCVELIKRYAAKLRFSGYTASLGSGDNGNSLPSLGDGHQAASRFASASGGGFRYVANGASSLPKPGAVISIVEFIPGGHVGIICNHDAADAADGAVNIKIVEQNMPIDSWKEIRFTQRSGRWYGAMLNRGTYYDVVGWANPTG